MSASDDTERQDPPYDYSKEILPRSMPDFGAMSMYELVDFSAWIGRNWSYPTGSDDKAAADYPDKTVMKEAAEAEMNSRTERAGVDDVIAVAQKLWDDPKLRGIFERTGRYGNCTREERFAVSEFLDAQHVGKNFKTWRKDFVLAEVIARRIVWGEFASPDAPEVRAYVEARVLGSRYEYRYTPAECIDLAYAILNEPLFVENLQSPDRFNSSMENPDFKKLEATRYDERFYRWAHQEISESLIAYRRRSFLNGIDTEDAILWLQSINFREYCKSSPDDTEQELIDFTMKSRDYYENNNGEVRGYDRFGEIPHILNINN